jgi:hypothetical protein
MPAASRARRTSLPKKYALLDFDDADERGGR